MRTIRRSVVVLLLGMSSARADAVGDWTKIALHAVISESSQLHAAREMAAVHVAMFESMNFVEGIYDPRFVVMPPQPLGISSEPVAAAAAHYVLVRLHPEQERALDAGLRRSLASMADAREKSSALVTGRALGANIYGILARDLSAAGAAISGGAPRTSRVRASTRESGAIAVAWYWMVAQNAEARHLKPIESARLYALVSLALSEVYETCRDPTFFHEPSYPCIPCAAGAAVQVILEYGSGTARISEATLADAGAAGAAYVVSRMREYGRGLSPKQLDRDAGRQSSIEAGEKTGRTIGLRALENYKPSRDR